MKRIALITLIIAAIAWMGYAGYELFYKDSNRTAPENVFCELDEGILLINRLSETEKADYLSTINSNELAPSIGNLDSLFTEFPYLKIYASEKRNIVILENEGNWKLKHEKEILKYFPIQGVTLSREGEYLLITKDYSYCNSSEKLTFFIEADKKASANFWEFENENWKRTDIYNLDKGFFEYRSSYPKATYGKAINDLENFASVLPAELTNYSFFERFYAVAKDSNYRNGPMSKWVDLGFVSFNYRGTKVLCSDYRSKQQPRLILIEKSKSEDSIQVEEDINSFINFKLTSDFPMSSENRFFVLEIEDKVFFSEQKSVLQQIQVDYQLGKTLALKPEKEQDLFGGLPTYANYRYVGKEKKMSLTGKDNLLFEVNTSPPKNQLESFERTTWSYSPEFKIEGVVPIPDHLRKGTSVFIYDDKGRYQLLGPNGNLIWSGKTSGTIKGEVQIVDVFENEKHQFLFRTENSVHLLDLNGNSVGGFPYKCESALTSSISSFVWNGTKRFLVGTEKGEVIMLNSSGRELNIVQISSEPILEKSYALNIRGNLRNWAIDDKKTQFLGYLETPAKAENIGKTSASWFVKHEGTVKAYYEKDGEVYLQTVDDQDGKLIESGKIIKVDDKSLYIKKSKGMVVVDHTETTNFVMDLAFNEVSSMYSIELKNKEALLLMDYLKNKIYLYNNLGETYEGFPKEGRNRAYLNPNDLNEKLSIFTTIENAVICYKVKL